MIGLNWWMKPVTIFSNDLNPLRLDSTSRCSRLYRMRKILVYFLIRHETIKALPTEACEYESEAMLVEDTTSSPSSVHTSAEHEKKVEESSFFKKESLKQ